MDKTLKMMYLRLDSTTKSLTKNAISQLLIKILYAKNKQLTESQVIAEYKTILNKKVNEDQIRENLTKLIEDNSIRYQSGSYYLSKNKRDKINLSYKESEERKEQIIETYIKPYFSEDFVVAEWLSNTTQTFFKLYSSEWMTDICYRQRTTAISNIKDGILKTIHDQTLKNKAIDKRDREILSQKYINLLTTKDILIDSYLWEYGTASFSAQLISSSIGADEFSLETFKDCNCLIDTNVLMNIGLEASNYYKAFKSLEEVFQSLNITVGILDITKEEYKRTIGNKRDEILRMVEKYPLAVVKETDDQYIKTAIARQCRTVEDFSRFFSKLMDVPEYIEEKVKINLFDDDINMMEEISQSQKDEQKLNELNSIYKNITGRDKKRHALIHDVGLIAGANYLRTKDKYFILSLEVSVNSYAKLKPSVNDLPISIKLETLINILAIDNGGINVDASDYATLFASMIRKGLTPNRDIFKIEDLSLMLEKNEQIAQLPSEETIRIAKEVNRNRMLGVDDEKIALEMTRKIQGVKLKIVDDLADAKTELSLEKQEKSRYKKEADASTKALYSTIKGNISKKYDNKILKYKVGFFVGFPLIILTIISIGYFLYKNNSMNNLSLLDYIISISVTIIIELLMTFIMFIPKIRSLKTNRENYIEVKTERKIKQKLEQI